MRLQKQGIEEETIASNFFFVVFYTIEIAVKLQEFGSCNACFLPLKVLKRREEKQGVTLISIRGSIYCKDS